VEGMKGIRRVLLGEGGRGNGSGGAGEDKERGCSNRRRALGGPSLHFGGWAASLRI